jgi:hypothetical protein
MQQQGFKGVIPYYEQELYEIPFDKAREEDSESGEREEDTKFGGGALV